jgi:hypothetical protein
MPEIASIVTAISSLSVLLSLVPLAMKVLSSSALLKARKQVRLEIKGADGETISDSYDLSSLNEEDVRRLVEQILSADGEKKTSTAVGIGEQDQQDSEKGK